MVLSLFQTRSAQGDLLASEPKQTEAEQGQHCRRVFFRLLKGSWEREDAKGLDGHRDGIGSWENEPRKRNLALRGARGFVAGTFPLRSMPLEPRWISMSSTGSSATKGWRSSPSRGSGIFCSKLLAGTSTRSLDAGSIPEGPTSAGSTRKRSASTGGRKTARCACVPPRT